MARVVLLGTPQFAVPVLRALVQHHQVVSVVTQPDRQAGRGRSHFALPAVKEAALALGLPVLQTVSLRRDAAALAALREARADLFVIAAFGQILRPEVLAIPPHGCIGVHASLLPRLRGAAPVAAAILRGDEETGVSLMLTDVGMDTGPVIAQARLLIAPRDTTETLSEKLSHIGAELLIATIPAWLAGGIGPVPQDDVLASYAPQITKRDGAIAWSRSAEEIDRQVRAYTPWPGVFTTYHGRGLRIQRAVPLSTYPGGGVPGTVIDTAQGIGVMTGRGLLLLEALQLEGKRSLSGKDFARGQRGFVGSILG